MPGRRRHPSGSSSRRSRGVAEPMVSRAPRRAGPAWLRLVVGAVLAVAAVTIGLLGDAAGPDVLVVLCFALVVAGRGLVQLAGGRRRPRLRRRTAQSMVLVAVAGLAVAVRAVVQDTPSEIPGPVLVLLAVLAVLVSVLVLALLPRQPASS
jgi:peptidoglycan/LPS O-acetylase OafA/YrhL